MNSEEIKTGEYSNFDTGISTIKSFNDSLETTKENINKYKESLCNDGVFKGPISDSCEAAFLVIADKFALETENYSTISSYLEQSKNRYLSSDENAKQLYLSIKGDGKLQVTEGLAATPYVNPNAEQYQVDFINQILPSAIALYNEKGILPSLTIGQACKESAFGTAKPGSGYNVFGIKASGWTGKTANASTKEDTSNGLVTINASFRDYDTLEAAVHDYGEVLSLERYDAVRAAKDYKEAAHAVKAGGYATGRNYDNSLITDYIEAYNLNQWDPVK